MNWYLSFADKDRFLGAVVISADSLELACIAAARAGINPGGQVLGLPMPTGYDLPPSSVGRLLSKEDVLTLFGPAVHPDGSEVT